MGRIPQYRLDGVLRNDVAKCAAGLGNRPPLAIDDPDPSNLALMLFADLFGERTKFRKRTAMTV